MSDIIQRIDEDSFTVTKTVTENGSLLDLQNKIDTLNSDKQTTIKARDDFSASCNKHIDEFDQQIRALQDKINAVSLVAYDTAL